MRMTVYLSQSKYKLKSHRMSALKIYAIEEEKYQDY